MIKSLANPQVKNLCGLMQKAKLRREQKCFVAEGRKMFLEAPIEQIQKVYLTEKVLNERSMSAIHTKLAELEHAQIKTELLSDAVFKSVSDAISPQGIITVVKQQEYSLEDLLATKNPLFILLEDLQDPGNLGTIIRTAEGAGATAVMMSKTTVDLFNPKTIRSTMGSVFRMPYLYVERMDEMIERLKHANVQIIAAQLKNSMDYASISYKKGTALLIGNESMGLSNLLCDKSDVCVKIPMEGNVESLNAAVAAAIIMYEAYRQRR